MMIGKSIPFIIRISWCLVTPFVMLVRTYMLNMYIIQQTVFKKSSKSWKSYETCHQLLVKETFMNFFPSYITTLTNDFTKCLC